MHGSRKKEGVCVSSETFIRALYELAEHCDFPDKNDQIRGQICDWTERQRCVKKKLQLRSTLTFKIRLYNTHDRQNLHFSAKQTHNRRNPITSYPQCDRCKGKHGQDARCPARC